MRFIAGRLKGRKILSVPERFPVKPISSRMRQSLFDILRPMVPGSYFLDLFAGCGTVGMEAVSRGAQKAVFVEKDPRVVRYIERNVENLGLGEVCKVLRGDVLKSLSWVKYRGGIEQFDVIFLGPPYYDREGPKDDKGHREMLSFVNPTLENIVAAGILQPKGWVVAQHLFREKVEAPKALKRFRLEKYGDTHISFFHVRT